jgi:hypothetical protein
MQVAQAFKSASVADFGTLTIDARALYAPAAPDVPQDARAFQIPQSKTGLHGFRSLQNPCS